MHQSALKLDQAAAASILFTKTTNFPLVNTVGILFAYLFISDKTFDKQANTIFILMHNQATFQPQHLDSNTTQEWMETNDWLEHTAVEGEEVTPLLDLKSPV